MHNSADDIIQRLRLTNLTSYDTKFTDIFTRIANILYEIVIIGYHIFRYYSWRSYGYKIVTKMNFKIVESIKFVEKYN